MRERENESFIPHKKFKSSHQRHEEIFCGGHKGNSEAGSYYLGPVIKKYVRAPVTQCLARKKGTDDYYLMKILVLDDSSTSDKCSYVRRTVFHNEYSILSLLKNHPGVIQLHDFFKDCVYDECKEQGKELKLKRVCMVLECLIPHSHHNSELIPLSHYLKGGRLSETEALYIFYNLLLVIKDLHNKNIVHRDLKLPNIILNRKTLKIKLIEFSYAQFLTFGQPALSKTYDMRSACFILYEMLNGCPLLSNSTNYNSYLSSDGWLHDHDLRFMENDCIISNNSSLSDGTKNILRNILWKIPQFRLKASEAVDMVSTLLALQSSSQNPSLFSENKNSDQVVPECPDFDFKDQQERTTSGKTKSCDKSLVESESEREARDAKQKAEKSLKTTDEGSDLFPASPPVMTSVSSKEKGLLDRKEIKYAMLRLGVTSVNNINALSFSYAKRSTCQT